MDFQLNEDQRVFADTADALFADYCSDDQLRAHDQSGAPFMQALIEDGGLMKHIVKGVRPPA